MVYHQCYMNYEMLYAKNNDDVEGWLSAEKDLLTRLEMRFGLEKYAKVKIKKILLIKFK